MNGLLCRRVKPGFLQTDSGFQQCLTGTRLYLLRNHRKGGMAGKFFRSTGFIQRGIQPDITTAAGQTVQGGVVHCHLCDGGKNLRTVADGMPGRFHPAVLQLQCRER